MERDMSKAEFDAACKRRGFSPVGFMGYYSLPVSSGMVMVSVLNAGQRRRDQLAYLIRAFEARERKAVNS